MKLVLILALLFGATATSAQQDAPRTQEAATPLPVVTGCPPATLSAGTVVIPAGTVCSSRVVLTGTAPKRITGAGALRVTSGDAVEIGTFRGSASNILIDVALIDGGGTGRWGIWLRNDSANVVIEKTEITGFSIGLHLQGMEESTGVVVRNNNVHHNSGMGLLGRAQGLQIAGNTFARNNFSGSAFNHGIYLSADGIQMSGIRVVGNRLDRNSVIDGVCKGGNFTVHGVYEDLRFEGNTIVQDKSSMGCYGVSITPAYASAERFTGVVVRGNTIVNTGLPIAIASAPGVVVERNLIRGAATEAAIYIPGMSPGAEDAADGNEVVRDNVVCGVRRVKRIAQAFSDAGGTLVSSCAP
jgi:hypothetical protein